MEKMRCPHCRLSGLVRLVGAWLPKYAGAPVSFLSLIDYNNVIVGVQTVLIVCELKRAIFLTGIGGAKDSRGLSVAMLIASDFSSFDTISL
jgi:hypothetical protein